LLYNLPIEHFFSENQPVFLKQNVSQQHAEFDEFIFQEGKRNTQAVSIIHQYPVPRLSKQNIFICISSDFLFRSIYVLQCKYSFKNM